MLARHRALGSGGPRRESAAPTTPSRTRAAPRATTQWSVVFEATRDGRRRRAFVLLHVPLFAVLLWLIAHPDAAVRYGTMLGLDAFLVVHAGLHWRLSGHPKHEFDTPHSRLLIFGTAALAAAHALVLVLVG